MTDGPEQFPAGSELSTSSASQESLRALLNRLVDVVSVHGEPDASGDTATAEAVIAQDAEQLAREYLAFLADPEGTAKVLVSLDGRDRVAELSEGVGAVGNLMEKAEEEGVDLLTALRNNLQEMETRSSQLIIDEPSVLEAAGYGPMVKAVNIYLDDARSNPKCPCKSRVMVIISYDRRHLSQPDSHVLTFEHWQSEELRINGENDGEQYDFDREFVLKGVAAGSDILKTEVTKLDKLLNGVKQNGPAS